MKKYIGYYYGKDNNLKTFDKRKHVNFLEQNLIGYIQAEITETLYKIKRDLL